MNNDQLQNLIQNAIKAATKQEWVEAVKINKEILSLEPKDIPALNRLGIALSMAGDKEKSQKTFEKVLKIDPTNTIAKNNLQRLKTVKKGGLANPYQHLSFIEEPGKSKVISLVNQAEPKTFASLNIGEPVELATSKHKVKVITSDNKFIGYLPDLISHRLIELISGGYKYKSLMKSVNPKSPAVFVQETYTSKKYKGMPSFPLDDQDSLPNLSAGESSEIPPLEIYDPAISGEE